MDKTTDLEICEEIKKAYNDEIIPFDLFCHEFRWRKKFAEIGELMFIYHDRYGLTVNCVKAAMEIALKEFIKNENP